jgi:hypothetical protein
MKRYDSVPVSDLTLKEVERSLRLKYDAFDLEMKTDDRSWWRSL